MEFNIKLLLLMCKILKENMTNIKTNIFYLNINIFKLSHNIFYDL